MCMLLFSKCKTAAMVVNLERQSNRAILIKHSSLTLVELLLGQRKKRMVAVATNRLSHLPSRVFKNSEAAAFRIWGAVIGFLQVDTYPIAHSHQPHWVVHWVPLGTYFLPLYDQ